MGRKRQRPQQQLPPRGRDLPRWKRSEIKRARVREFLKEGLTKADMDQRREIYHCMKYHPGRYCRECHPRLWEEKPKSCSGGDSDDGEEESSNPSDEEADLSDSWSDHSDGDFETASVTYSEAWAEEADRDSVINWIKESIATVDAAAERLEKTQPTEKPRNPPVGNLHGRWDLYNLDVCPETPTEERFQLHISRSAVEGPVLPRSHFNRGHPLQSFMQWFMRCKYGGVVPFQLPTNASLKPIPITFVPNYEGKAVDIPTEIVFLGRNCMRLKVPKSLLRKKTGRTGQSDEMVEFSGIRLTKADIAKAKEKREEDERLLEEKRRRESSPPGCDSIAASFLGYLW